MIKINFTYDDKFCFSSSFFVPYSSCHFNSLKIKCISDKTEPLMATPNANKTQMSDMLPYIFPFLRFDSLDFKWVPLGANSVLNENANL